MKRVFVNAWAAKNLGDDLFLKILSDRYKNEMYCVSILNYENAYNSLKFVNENNVFLRIFRKINKVLFRKTISYKKYICSKCDLMVSIGGSIFIENTDNSKNISYLSIYNECRKPYYILGCNIGPYRNEAYIELLEENVFKRAVDICFRDEASLALIDGANARCCPDIVFSLDKSFITTEEKKKVIISLINCREKESQIGFDITHDYIDKIIEMINILNNNGYAIELMSFCRFEKDEDIIYEIKNKVSNIKIDTYFYDGDINEALNEVNTAEIIIGSRFHANIIGILLNKKILPISYNNKTINTLNDIGYIGPIIKLNEINMFDCQQLLNLKRNKIDLSELRKKSELQFQELDKVLEKR